MQQKRYSSDLTARQWQGIAPLFVVQRISKWPLQAVVNGIFYVLKNGCVWRDVPADLPPWATVYYCFTKWSTDGTWERVSGWLSIAARERAKKTPSLLPPSSDSQSVKNTATSTAQVGDDAGKRIKGRKRFFWSIPWAIYWLVAWWLRAVTMERRPHGCGMRWPWAMSYSTRCKPCS